MTPKTGMYLFTGGMAAVGAGILTAGIQADVIVGIVIGAVLLALGLFLVGVTVRAGQAEPLSAEEMEVRRARMTEALRSSPRTLRWGPWGWGAGIAMGAGMLVEDIIKGSLTWDLGGGVAFAAMCALQLRGLLRERRKRVAEGERL